MTRRINGRALVKTPEGCIHGFKHGADTGKVYAYIVVAETKLGRHLLAEEIVHHIDRNPSNDAPENLLVFASNSDHAAFHASNCNMELIKQNSNGSWYFPTENRSVRGRCEKCGAVVYDRTAKLCLKCYKDKSQIKDGWFSKAAGKVINKADLENLVKVTSISQIAKQYGVNDHSVVRWCQKLGIKYK